MIMLPSTANLLSILTNILVSSSLISAIAGQPHKISSSSPAPPYLASSSTPSPLSRRGYVEKPPAQDPETTAFILVRFAVSMMPSIQETYTTVETVELRDVSSQFKSTPSLEGGASNINDEGDSVSRSYGNSLNTIDKANTRTEDAASSKGGSDGEIIRIGHASFKDTKLVFATEYWIDPYPGTTCTLDEPVSPEFSSKPPAGRERRIDSVQTRSRYLPNIIPSNYAPDVKLASGITCVQRRTGGFI